jgi:hypothetical protein
MEFGFPHWFTPCLDLRLWVSLKKRFPPRLKEAAEKLAAPAKSSPQALKRGPIFSDLTARVELVPFPSRLEPEFFLSL